jgi:hypothetical protein
VHNRLKELVNRAEIIGWTYEGLDRNSHAVFTKDGVKYRTGSNPSDHRALENAISAMERIGGVKAEKPNHRKSHKNPKAEEKKVSEWLAAARRKAAARKEAEEAREARRIAKENATLDSYKRERNVEFLMKRDF